MRKRVKRLTLSRETVYNLTGVVGGAPITTSVYQACSDSCYSNCGQVSCQGSTCSYPPNCYASYPDICTPGPI